MAYATSGGGSIADFIAALKAFALAQGWASYNDGVNVGSGGRLLLYKGVAHIAIEYFNVYTVNSYPAQGAAPVVIDNHFVYAYAYTGFVSGAATRWWGHENYPYGGAAPDGAACCANLAGPLAAWYFFSDAGGNYIHCAVNSSGDLFTHLCFGIVEKGDLTHGGACYVGATANPWYAERGDIGPGSNSFGWSKPAFCRPPFQYRMSISANDAFPTDFGKIASPSFFGSNTYPLEPIRAVNGPNSYPNNDGHGALLDHLTGASAPAWSAQTPMYGMPCIGVTPDQARACCIGMFPDVRLVNLDGLSPGQEITFTTDTWKVFPWLRQTRWQDAGVVWQPASGQYGIAYKKI